MTPRTIRTIRIESELWDSARERAESEETTVSELVRVWLADYSAGRRRHGPGRPDTVELSRAELEKLRSLVDRLLG